MNSKRQPLLLILVLTILSSCGTIHSSKIKLGKKHISKIETHEMRSENLESSDKAALSIDYESDFINSNPEEIVLTPSVKVNVNDFIAKTKVNFDFEDKCDVILLRSGEEVSAKILEVGINEIKYKKCNNLDGPIYSVLKDDVFMITYSNGSKDVYKEKPREINEPEKQNVNNTTVKYSHPAGVVALVLGILALVVGGLIYWPIAGLGLPAFILGIVGASDVSRHPEKYIGKTASVLGIIFGIISIILLILTLVILL